jgi:peptidoglycan hydrolase-like protein with peptidoglycan-binding domain
MFKWERTLKQGDYGEDVGFLQNILVMCGAPHYPPHEIDGDFGPRTKEAVIWFQKKHNLPENGIVDKATQDKLPIPLIYLLRQGDEDTPADPEKVVTALQNGLKASGYPNTVLAKIDGKFGPETKKAVIAYQKAIQVDMDGVVGYDTWWEREPNHKPLAELAGLTKPC